MLLFIFIETVIVASSIDENHEATHEILGKTSDLEGKPKISNTLYVNNLFLTLENYVDCMSLNKRNKILMLNTKCNRISNPNVYKEFTILKNIIKATSKRGIIHCELIKITQLLVHKKRCLFKPIYIAVYKHLFGIPETLRLKFYDNVINALNHEINLDDDENHEMPFKIMFTNICLKKIVLSIVNTCRKKYDYLEFFILFPEIVTRNINEFIYSDFKKNRFIFYNDIVDYINDDRIVESKPLAYTKSEKDAFNMFIEKIYIIVTKLTSVRLEKYKNSSYALYIRDSVDQSLKQTYIQALQTIFKNYWNDLIRKTAYKNCAEQLPIAVPQLDIENISYDNYIILFKLYKQNKTFQKYFFEPVELYSESFKMARITAFLGITQKLKHKNLKYNGNMVIIPSFHIRTQSYFDYLKTIYTWLCSLKVKSKLLPSWKFRHVDIKELVDIRDFIPETFNEAKAELIKSRSGLFNNVSFINNAYGIYSILEKQNFFELVKYVIDSGFAGSIQASITRRFNLLMGFHKAMLKQTHLTPANDSDLIVLEFECKDESCVIESI